MTESEVWEVITERIRKTMAEQGLTVAAISSTAPSWFDQGKVASILQGEHPVLSLEDVFVLAGCLRITPAGLLGGIEWVPNESPDEGYVRTDL
jgi:hypothetical protein